MPRARPGWAAQDAPRCPSPVTMSFGPPSRGLPVFLLPLRDPKVNSEPDPQWAICSPERATGCHLELATRRWPHPPPVAGVERDRAWPSCPCSVHSTCWPESLLVGRMCKRTGPGVELEDIPSSTVSPPSKSPAGLSPLGLGRRQSGGALMSCGHTVALPHRPLSEAKAAGRQRPEEVRCCSFLLLLPGG